MKRGLGIVMAVSWILVLGTRQTAAWNEDEFYRKPAVSYVAKEGDGIIGTLRAHRVRKGDTLLDIARNYSLGYNEIIETNPGLDVWLPPPGAMVLLPTAWILPCCSRSGLVVNIPEMRIYYFRPVAGDATSTEVITYGIGLGREDWQTPRGKFKIRSKTENPTWVIPESIRAERIERNGDARTHIPGGAPDNPLGKHRLALTLTGYGIHGSDLPWGVGMQVSHGCIRLYPEDIERLFPQVPVGTSGEFIYQPVKIGVADGDVYAEVTRDIYGLTPGIWREATTMIDRMGVADRVDRNLLLEALQNSAGFPVKISRGVGAERRMRVEVSEDARVSSTDACEARDD